MIEKGKRGGICHTIHQYAKANNKYMKYHDKNKNCNIFNTGINTEFDENFKKL